jgi:signal transduction histidine kinase
VIWALICAIPSAQHTFPDVRSDRPRADAVDGGSTYPQGMRRERLIQELPAFATGVALAIGLAFITREAAGAERGELDALAIVLCVVTGLALAFRRLFPLGQYVVAMAATLTYAASDYPGGPIYAVAFGSALAMVAGTERRTWMPAAFAGGALLIAVRTVAIGWAGHLFIFGAIWFVGTVLFGEVARLRREQARTVEARAEFAERTREEEARRRLAEERLQIARDVHDVVGHSLATIALQAGVAEHLLDGREPEARESMAAIRRLSKQALGEVGAMLGVLRADGTAERAPTPDLGQVTRLVDDMRAAGLQVDLDLDPEPVPEVVGGAAYRIVQESLTNVVRHAGPDAAARVTVRADNGTVEVEITDDGAGATTTHEGNGLTGMRERATALGGTFEVGPGPQGGFRVRALLPVR